MRKLALAALGGLMALPLSAQADDHDAVKVFYKNGTTIEFPDADIKFNVQLQPRYTYTDLDSEGRVDAGEDPVDDTSSFSMRRARLIVTGNVLNKQFSYQLNNDFASSTGGGEMKDAWIQWNGEPMKIRFGQMKVPFTRQQRVSSSKLFFPDRSLLDEVFSHDREFGVMGFFEAGEANLYTGLYNGDSTDEGKNRRGVDNKHNFYAAADFSSENFGSRGEEGDMRKDDRGLGFTVGGSLLYGEGESEDFGDDFDQIGLNADAAIRVEGAELQAEYYWVNAEADSLDAELDRNGFYLQGTYMMDKIGVGGRFGLIEPDDDLGDFVGVDDIQEYTLGIDYFVNGHYLKVQNQVTFEVTNFENDDDLTDLRYVLQLSGYF